MYRKIAVPVELRQTGATGNTPDDLARYPEGFLIRPRTLDHQA